MKMKFGTQLDDSVYEQLKVASARARRPMGEMVEQAITYYLIQVRPGRARRTGLARLLDRAPLALTGDQLRASMEEDVYDQ